jgi:transcriptional regulator with XRE-family HTH domain
MTEDFGSTLRLFRLRAGYSQNALAKIVCINASYVNRLETGEREAPTREVAAAIGRSLNLGVEDTDRLMFAAGHVPPSLQKLGGHDSTLTAIIGVLTDDRVTPDARADLRACIETMCARWSNSLPATVRLQLGVAVSPAVVAPAPATQHRRNHDAQLRQDAESVQELVAAGAAR